MASVRSLGYQGFAQLGPRGVNTGPPGAVHLARRVVAWVGWILGGACFLVVGALIVARLAAVVRERFDRFSLKPSHGLIVATDVGRMFVQEAGPPRGRVVVLLHGTGAWSEIWRPVMRPLAQAGYRVIAMDLPPFGFSDRSPVADYTPETQARRVWATLDSLGVGEIDLVGHSFGARATVAAALMREHRVRRLVLIDAALGLADTTKARTAAPLLQRVLFAIRPLRDAVVAATVTNPMMTRALTEPLVAFPEKLTDAQIAMLQRPLPQIGSTRAASDWLPKFVLDPGPDVRQMRRALAGFRQPTHLLWGELDTLTPVSDGRDLARLFPCATWDLLGGTGHIPGLENPAQLARAMLARLAGPPSCGGPVLRS